MTKFFVLFLFCVAPWGAIVPELTAVQAFESEHPPRGQTCRWEMRYCSANGFLSGFFQYPRCSETP